MIRKALINQAVLQTVLSMLTAMVVYSSTLNTLQLIGLMVIVCFVSYGIYKIEYYIICDNFLELTTVHSIPTKTYIKFLTSGNYFDRYLVFCLIKDRFSNEKAILEKIIDDCFNTLSNNPSSHASRHNHTSSMIRNLQTLYSEQFDLIIHFELDNDFNYSPKDHFEINFKKIIRYYGELYVQKNIDTIVHWYIHQREKSSADNGFSIHDKNFFGNIIHMMISDNGTFGGPHLRGQILELLHNTKMPQSEA